MMKEIYYATGNRGKFEMVQKYLNAHLPDLTIKQVDLDLIEEQSLDLEAISVFKAKQAWSELGKPVIVDDAGVYFERYKNFPGAMTKFIFQALGFEGLYKLYDEGDKAHFDVFLTFIWGENNYKTFIGDVAGRLIKPQNLEGDFDLPFTHLIIPEGSDKSIHESRVEAGYSNYEARIVAMGQFVDFLRNYY